MPPPHKVFLSYSREPAIDRRVLDLSQDLRRIGLDCWIDQYEGPGGPDIGFTLWMEQRIESSDFVILICTAAYDRKAREEAAGTGTSYEVQVIRTHLATCGLRNKKFRAVQFDRLDKSIVPVRLRDHRIFVIPKDSDELIDFLFGNMVTAPLTLGEPPDHSDGPIDAHAVGTAATATIAVELGSVRVHRVNIGLCVTYFACCVAGVACLYVHCQFQYAILLVLCILGNATIRSDRP